jgi:phospholipase C
MLENRTFDHIFGFRAGVNGLKGTESNLLDPSQPASVSNPSFVVTNTAPYAVPIGGGPGHLLPDTNVQLCGDASGPNAQFPAKNNGFVKSYANNLKTWDHVLNPTPDQIRVVMQCFAPGSLPSINDLADAFVLCDNWFAEVPGPTHPNRLYMHAATSFGYAHNLFKQNPTFSGATIYQHVQDAGLTWATYEHDYNEVSEFSQINKKRANFKKFNPSFAADVKAGTLPSYSFILPRFMNQTTALANSEHPPEDMRLGDNFIADVYETLQSNPNVWNKSALIVTYDEHGGWYDHVIPPSQGIPNPDGLNSPPAGDKPNAPKFAFDRLGLRVPAIVASPWVKAGTVDSTAYRHTSVLATVKKMFGLKDFLTKRDTTANTFEGLFTQLGTARSDTPKTLKRVPLPKIGVAPTDPAHPANRALDETQQAALLRVYYLTQSSHPKGPSIDQLPKTQNEAAQFIQQRYREHFGQ